MIESLSYVVPILAICLAIPIALFLHELGHAVPIVAAGGHAHIMVGNTEGRTTEIGPIRVTVGADGIWSPFYFGRCHWNETRSWTVQAAGLLAGPVMTLLVVVATGVAISTVQHELIRFAVVGLFYNQVWLAFATLFPMEYPSWWGLYAGTTSDGYKFLTLLRG